MLNGLSEVMSTPVGRSLRRARDVFVMPGIRRTATVELSIVIPAYNECHRLGPTLMATLDYLDQRCIRGEVLVVDDGSVDSTAQVALAFGRVDSRVRLLCLGENRGKGAAVRAGVLAAKGDRVLFMDADLATPIEELESLEQALLEGHDIAVGSRALATSNITVRQSRARALMGRTFNALVRLVAVGGICDTQCGFKLFTRRAAQALFGEARIDRFAFDVEILLLARGRFTVAEVPVAWRHVGESKVSPVRDALRMAVDVLRMRLRMAMRSAASSSQKTPLRLAPSAR